MGAPSLPSATRVATSIALVSELDTLRTSMVLTTRASRPPAATRQTEIRMIRCAVAAPLSALALACVALSLRLSSMLALSASAIGASWLPWYCIAAS
ncbi:hypothetical protein D9M70_365040 [compost metagenome]